MPPAKTAIDSVTSTTKATSQELFERLLAKHRRRHPSGLPEQP